jgi:hypothetical protein
MTKKYNNTTIDVMRSIRKPMPPSGRVMEDDKTTQRRKDMKKGRQDWSRHIDESLNTKKD